MFPLKRLTGLTPLLTLLLLSGSVLARWDDPVYHHYDEILPALLALQEANPEIMRIDTIGYSQLEHLPIICALFNEDVADTTTVRPAVVFNGQVHAEEITGVEYVMSLAEKMMTREARQWRRWVDTYLIPTANPEGLTVVYSLDNTYRKNKRDNIGDGLFRFQPGWGGDSSGADPNRNFPLFWTHGTGLFVTGDNEFYDYYRGPAPASETEVRCLINFMERVRPLYSLTIHSSRTGNVSEQVLYPWGWGTDEKQKRPPDIAFNDEMANQIALRCKKFGGAGTSYDRVRISANSDAENFYHYYFGIYGIRVEIGQEGENMQPDSADLAKTIRDVSPGFEWLLNSAAGVTEDDKGSIIAARLNIHVTDAATDQPLYARLKLDSRSSRVIPYRYTNPRNGFYYWMLSETFVDTLRVSRFGYSPWKGRVICGRNPSQKDVSLTPLPWHDVVIGVHENGVLIELPVELQIQHADTFWTHTIIDGKAVLNLPEGEYQLTLSDAAAHVPRIVTIAVSDNPATWEHYIGLNPAAVLFAQNFDAADVIHTSDNVKNLHYADSLAHWELTREISHSAPSCLTDSRNGNTPILEDGWDAPYNMMSRSFDLSGMQSAMLTYWLNQALEPDNDSMWVEFAVGNTAVSHPSEWNWVQAAPAHQELAILNWRDEAAMQKVINRPWNANRINCMNFHDWEHVVIPVPVEFLGQPSVHFRFHLKTDYILAEDGVYIDDVYLLGSGLAAPQITSQPPLPERFSLGPVYPNPFNGRFSVKAHLPTAGCLSVAVYDVFGRRAMEGPSGDYAAGSHLLSLDVEHLPSGIYFLRADAAGRREIRKITLLR